YLDVYENGFYIPIVKSSIDHKGIIEYGDEIEITVTLIPSRAAKIIFEYEVFNLTKNRLAATGKTTQVFMQAETKELFLNIPEFYTKWLNGQGIQ
ncbi:MAG: acyl-CoA thioesterase, partial [Flavobacteriales bacterium]|nr:acyl-CoA thioesterase [Flavobacteriales bacterium]